MHRDIKPSNIMFDPDTLKVRVIDWGIADFYFPGQKYGTKVGTLPYKAPEILLGFSRYHYAVDMWSIGCVLAQFMYGKRIFHGQNDTE